MLLVSSITGSPEWENFFGANSAEYSLNLAYF